MSELEELKRLVGKQSVLLAQTGKRVMELQMQAAKEKPRFDPEDYATNDDIVQLVTELQGQLDFLEDRNVARVNNSHASALMPLCSRDGVPPSNFPKTVEEFEAIAPVDLLTMADFYDLVVEPAPEDVQERLKRGELDVAEAQKLLERPDLEQRAKELSTSEINDIFDEVARFIGVRLRRVKQ